MTQDIAGPRMARQRSTEAFAFREPVPLCCVRKVVVLLIGDMAGHCQTVVKAGTDNVNEACRSTTPSPDIVNDEKRESCCMYNIRRRLPGVPVSSGLHGTLGK